MNKKLIQKLKNFTQATQLFCMSVDDQMQAFEASKEYRAVQQASQELLAELDAWEEPTEPPSAAKASEGKLS